jgi:sulfonate transport system ATP-binding protein
MDAAISSQTALAFDVAEPYPAAGASLTLRSLGKRFGETRVLENLDLHASAGQFVAVVGRSGCGKSTLLRLVAGLDVPDAGRVALAGQARMMFQEPRLLPWLSVLANVEVGFGRERGRPDALAQARRAL